MNDTETTLKETHDRAVAKVVTTGDESWVWLWTLTSKKLKELKAGKEYVIRDAVTPPEKENQLWIKK